MIVCKYKFDKSIYSNLIPVFNDGYNGYSISDEIDSENSNYVIRTIECDVLPTIIRFGEVQDNASDKQYSLLKVLDINLSEVTTMDKLFTWCKNLTEINSNSTTSKVTSMYVAFGRCEKLIKLNMPNITTNLVTNMQGVFMNCHNLTSLDVSNFDTSNVTDMYCMFYSCNNLTSIGDISNWDTSKVTTMQSMFSGCHNLTSLDVSNFNTNNVTTMGYMFNECYNLTSLDVSNFDTSKVTNMNSMFSGCHKLTSLDVSNFDTSKVTNMNSMFQYCGKLTSLDVSNWNTSNVTNMTRMFEQCNALISVNVASWNLGNVTNISYMFANCVGLLELDVSNWNTEKVTTLYQTFYNCNKLISLDVSNFNTSNVTTMQGMFYNCTNLSSLDVSNWDTSKVTSIQSMFYYCKKLTSLDVSNWDTNKVTDMSNMFYYCNTLKNINICNWNFGKVTNVRSMFSRCFGINSIDAKKLDFTNCINNIGEFIHPENCTQLKYFRCDVSSTFNDIYYMLPDRVDKEQGMIISDAEISEEILTRLKAKNWTVVSSDTLTKVAKYVYDSKIWNSMIPEFNSEFVEYFIDDVEDENGLVTRTISSMGDLPTLMRFGIKWVNANSNIANNNSKSLLEVISMDTSNLTTMLEMFRLNENVKKISCEWDTSKVTDMYAAFTSCVSLTSLDLSNFDTSNVNNMYGMFYNCRNLTSLDVSNFNTSKVTNMRSMFYYCTSLISLDLSNFNTNNVKDMSLMFHNCNSLTSLNVSNWNTTNVTNMSSMFNNCKALTSLDLSDFDTSNVTNMAYMFDNCNKLTSLDISNFNTSKLTSTERLSNRWWYSTHSIGMLYCDKDTINKLTPLLKGNGTPTIYVKDVKPNELTSVEGIEFKEYKENGYMINLSSPLLNGDRIEVVDGKLCHYHKMGSVVLDGSEDDKEFGRSDVNDTLMSFNYFFSKAKTTNNYLAYCNNFKCIHSTQKIEHFYIESWVSRYIAFYMDKSKLSSVDINGFKQWLSENPTTVVYELLEPYYEDITPLQSDIVLETYLECNMDIYTDLPIKANVSYITNVPSLSTLSMRATEMKESDNIIANLTNMLDNEINE